MRRRLIAAAAALLLAGCSVQPARQEPPPAKESTFVYARHLVVVTDWDPATSYSNEIVAMQNIYESLTVYNPVTKKASPRLATSWRVTPDGRTWTFTLRSGVTFHTGRPLDAAAVKSSIERTMRSGSGPSYIWDAVENIRADDPLTVTFTLKYPVPLDLVASSGYAAYIYDTAAARDLKAWFAAGRDAGTGPYTIATWKKGKRDELTLKAYRPYWGGWNRPHYTSVKFLVIPDPGEAWQRLLRGEASFVNRLNPALYRRAAGTAGVRTAETPSFQTAMLLFNTASGPLADVRIRRALRKTIDYDGTLRALRGAASPATGVVPEGLLGHLPGRTHKQDLQGATELLAAAGYGPGGRALRLTLTYAEGDEDQRVFVERLVATLAPLNITLVARAMPWDAQWARGKTRGQDIFLMYWWPDYADAYSWFAKVFRSAEETEFNLTYLKDRVADGLIDTLPELTVTDRAAAQRAYARLDRRLLDVQAAAAVPWVVNYQRAYLGGIQGYNDNPAYPEVVFAYDLRPAG
ncbi:ABC transporter substrate-binding protein [Nonomuraea africana]|uniref:Peptide/nickel transport system substrate-binding protein n=1 Tax=Nonomuraea africana TaxID=46171 RepID=A0ABR9KKY4_9ACTN|nr:ABC transporter substrate-binding protein [Nonomuraea africana]MBE1562674.1 peptide/nickel transport system substrate-binding protein [Nonomuraea africana]